MIFPYLLKLNLDVFVNDFWNEGMERNQELGGNRELKCGFKDLGTKLGLFSKRMKLGCIGNRNQERNVTAQRTEFLCRNSSSVSSVIHSYFLSCRLPMTA